MASGHKELGQIHTVNFYIPTNTTGLHDLDVSGQLSQQLQRTIRQGNMFKVVGIDATVAELGGKGGGASLSGYLRYYAPTKGRCSAYREAFNAMRTAMNLQGINMRDNPQYDFRVLFNSDSSSIPTVATLDGTDPLCLFDIAGGKSSTTGVFNVHNAGVTSTVEGVAAGDLFKAGFNTMGVQNTPTDFVLYDAPLFDGNAEIAETDWESIPFQLSYSPGSDDTAFTLQWRPDPALYLAVMTGLFQLNVEEIDFNGGSDNAEISIAIHIAGWKSIMGNPDKKKKRSSRGRRRRKK